MRAWSSRFAWLLLLVVALAAPAAAGVDVAIHKSHDGALFSGYAATYHLAVESVGTDATSGAVIVRDTLPAELAYNLAMGSGWTVTVSGSVVTCRHPAPIEPGETAETLDLFVYVQGSPGATVVNAATVSANGDVDTSNNRSVDAAIITVADVDIDKRHTGQFVVGSDGAYQVVVHNLNIVATTSEITVRDTLPAGLTFVDGSGTGWSVTESAGIVTATYSSALAAGDSAAFDLTVGIGAAAYPGVANAASVSLLDDSNPANDRDVDTVAVDTVAVPRPMDLSITKQHQGQFAVGEEGTYRIVVRNLGQVHTQGVTTVRDTLPPGITFIEGSGTGWTVSASGQVVTATNAQFIGPSVISLVVAVGLAAYPSVTNAASVSTPGDPNEANNRDVDFATVEGPPDLTVDKRHIGSFVVGGTASYVITIRNIGLGRTTYPVYLNDVIPSSLKNWTAHGNGWNLGALGGSALNASYANPILAGDSTTVVIDGFTILSSAYPTVTNGAAIHGVPNDSDPGNDSDTDVAEVTYNRPDLAITMRHAQDFTAGQLATYTIVVTNVGVAPSQGVIGVRDTLPAAIVFASGTGSQWTASADFQIVSAGYSGTIAVGDSAVLNLTVAVGNYAVPATTNRATVYGTADTNAVNDVAEDMATVYPGVGAVPSSDRLVVESVSPNPIRMAGRVTFNVPARGRARLTVIDVQGREVAVVSDGDRSPGVHAVALDATGWSAGVYFLRLQCAGVETRRRFAIVR